MYLFSESDFCKRNSFSIVVGARFSEGWSTCSLLWRSLGIKMSIVSWWWLLHLWRLVNLLFFSLILWSSVVCNLIAISQWWVLSLIIFTWHHSFSGRCFLEFVRYLMLASSDDVVYSGTDVFYVVLSVKTFSYLFVGFNETLKFLLKAVILIVQICHMLIQCIHFSLQLNLIFIHLFRMVLKSVKFVTDALLILFQLLMENIEFSVFQLSIFTLYVFVFISFEKLLLCSLMLLILTFKVPELTIKIVQNIFVVLNDIMALTNFINCFGNYLFFVLDDVIHTVDTLVVIVWLGMEDLYSLWLLV